MFARIRKAVLAGLAAVLTGLLTAAVQKGAAPSWPEVGTALGLGVAAALAVWGVPNAGPKPPAGVTGTYGGNL